jgi:hypothetical protein
MECEDEIRPAIAGENTVQPALAFDGPGYAL